VLQVHHREILNRRLDRIERDEHPDERFGAPAGRHEPPAIFDDGRDVACDAITVSPPDHDRRAPFRRLEISFSQGAEWKALMSKYIGTIPLSGDASCAAEQSIAGEPLSRTPVSSAMMAKVGAAARHSQSAAPGAAALPLPAEPPAASRWVAIMSADPRLSWSIVFVPVERGDVQMSFAASTSRFGSGGFIVPCLR
jgi:hypothetical protein